jgi:hypothetical protein
MIRYGNNGKKENFFFENMFKEVLQYKLVLRPAMTLTNPSIKIGIQIFFPRIGQSRPRII